MLSFLPVLILASASVDGAQISLQFTRTTHLNPWKLPSFVKGARTVGPSTTTSSVLLQVRGGSDPYYNNHDDDYRRNDKPGRSEYGYEEEKKVEDDYYYGEQPDGRYYEEERRYDDRGRGGVSTEVRDMHACVNALAYLTSSLVSTEIKR